MKFCAYTYCEERLSEMDKTILIEDKEYIMSIDLAIGVVYWGDGEDVVAATPFWEDFIGVPAHDYYNNFAVEVTIPKKPTSKEECDEFLVMYLEVIMPSVLKLHSNLI